MLKLLQQLQRISNYSTDCIQGYQRIHNIIVCHKSWTTIRIYVAPEELSAARAPVSAPVTAFCFKGSVTSDMFHGRSIEMAVEEPEEEE
eukprot:scaffold21827_cov110-Isochrysis_galbana.AAC.1